MKMPRLMPLVAIAAGGVFAINAVENGPGIIGAARSFAEGVAAKHGDAKAATAVAADASATAPLDAAQVVAAKPAPICAESPAQLAKDAGLSPAELQVIQSLGARRGELDEREQGLDTQLALIQAAEVKVDARIATMNQLKADMQALVGQVDTKQQAEVDSLVKVYETMINAKPQDAADRFVLLSDAVRLPIAAKMKERLLSQMLAKMPPPEAKRLTESLAARYAAQSNAVKAAINPPPQAAAAPPITPAAAPPTPQLAQATATPDKPAKPATPHRKPKKPAPAATALAANKLPATPTPTPAVKPTAAPPPKPLAAAAPPTPKAAPPTPVPATPKPAVAAAAPTPTPAAATPPAKSG
jgi:flagellar motility protein MotE (MotC chaperone)